MLSSQTAFLPLCRKICFTVFNSEMNRIADTLVAMQEQEDVTLPALRRQLVDVEKGIENMLSAIQMGVLTASTKERLESLEQQRDELKLSIMTEELQKPKLSKEQIIAWIDQFRYGDINSVEYQKRVIDSFVNTVFVFDDKIVLTYTFKGSTQTITMTEIESVYGSDLVGVSPVKEFLQTIWLVRLFCLLCFLHNKKKACLHFCEGQAFCLLF